MRYFFLPFLISLFISTLFANESKVCQKCHPIIYEEYYKSSHKNASIYNNPIHAAMWDKHPKDDKGYTCAKCHSPSDEKALKEGVLTENEVQVEEPISCVYCHNIKEVQEGEESNTNITTGKHKEFYTAEKGKKGSAAFETEKSWFGLLKEPKSSPYHKINYDNENFYNGNVCMGCHSHVNNEHNFDITMLDAVISEKDKNSCVTCHMPQVIGSKVSINETKTHAFHGIAGIYHMNDKMGDYIDFKVTQKPQGFDVLITNKSNHALFGQALRAGILKATIIRDGKTIVLEPFVFERVLAKDGKEVMPWSADSLLKDTLIYAKKEVHFSNALKAGDKLTLTLGVVRITQEGAKELGLEAGKEFTKFRILKAEKFDF